jgi:Ca2+:H+ antiporter
MKNRMGLAVQIAVGSGLQIALFIAPLLVFISYLPGYSPMDLRFSMMEVVAVVASVIILGMVAMDGESNWLEGLLLLAVYAILGIAFYHLPVEPELEANRAQGETRLDAAATPPGDELTRRGQGLDRVRAHARKTENPLPLVARLDSDASRLGD